MPIEIRELQIKATIGSSNIDSASQSSKPANLDRMKQEIVKEVTENVLRMIQLKLER
ncbi:DUF5908 family protein [uncultured Algoriphagus sp.]|uniref:DUF5908 family protein n=1 Tax=uncultured Algoriphagus sp. TaxID=417365 RepID=UPI0030EC376C